MDIAPNASWHYVMGGIKDESLDDAKLARPLVGIRQTGFEDGNEIETETDEGHTGVSNLDMGSYRTTAESAPTWEDKFRYGEFLEDIFYLLLGKYTKTSSTTTDVYNVVSSVPTGVNTYVFEQNIDPENLELQKDLPVATIYNGFAKTPTDGRVFNNSLLNELEINFSADDAPTISPTFVSDYNNFNLLNPDRVFPTDTIFVKAPHTQVYVGAVGASIDDMFLVPIDCFTEASLTINHNAESQSCHGDEFGINTKIMGSRESEGSITMPWVDGTRLFEPEYEAFNKYGHKVSEEITHKQIIFRCYGGSIPRYSTSDSLNDGEKIIDTIVDGSTTTYKIDTGIPFETLILLPECEITNVESPKSGDEAKDLTMEFKVLEKPSSSYMYVKIVSGLSDLHIDNVGTTLDDFYPSPQLYPEFANTGTSTGVGPAG